MTLYYPERQAEKQGWKIINKHEVLADGPQAPGWVTLCRVKDGEYATHFFNAQDGGFHSGRYSTSVANSVADFNERVVRYTRHHARVRANRMMERRKKRKRKKK